MAANYSCGEFRTIMKNVEYLNQKKKANTI